MQRRALLAATASVIAFRPARPQDQRVLRFVPYADLVVTDPVWSSTLSTHTHALAVFDTLYGTAADTSVHPQMVAGHVVEADGLRWRLTLRDGLRFHDGTPVLARDCAASIRRWGRRDVFGQLLAEATEEIAAPDDRTILFRLKRPRHANGDRCRPAAQRQPPGPGGAEARAGRGRLRRRTRCDAGCGRRAPDQRGVRGDGRGHASLQDERRLRLDGFRYAEPAHHHRRPITEGSWSCHCTYVVGPDITIPATQTGLRANGSAFSVGWANSQALDALRNRWLEAETLAAHQAICREIQLLCRKEVPFIPLGQYIRPVAFRRSLTGIMAGVPVFTNLRKEA
jgi:hypothetical protein